MFPSLRQLALTAATVLALTALTGSAARATGLTPPPPASADCETSPNGTVCQWTEHFATPFPVPYGVSCDGFSVRVNLSGDRRATAFYGADGALTHRMRHASYVGTLINSVTGASVPHVGHFTIDEDFGAMTSAISGMLSRTVVSGDGLVWRNIGRIETSLANGALLFEAGEHGTWDVLGDPSISDQLCAALA
jgi:hypothetical protein